MRKLFLALSVILFSSLHAQSGLERNLGQNFWVDSSTIPATFHYTWWGNFGKHYLVQVSEDLNVWSFLPSYNPAGANAPLGVEFTNESPRIFVRAWQFDPQDVSGFADSDTDGVPDVWEEYYFGNKTTITGDRDADQNGDGISDWEAWLIGLNPAAPLPDRTPPNWSSGSGLTVTNETETGFTLSWSEAVDSGGGNVKYVLYRNGKPQGSAASGTTRQVSFTGISGWQRWNILPVDAGGNYGISSSYIERDVGQTVDVALSVRARNRLGSFNKWGFPPLKPEPELAPIVRSFAQSVTTEKYYSYMTINDGESDIPITNDHTRTLTEIKTPSGATSEFGGTSFSLHDAPNHYRKTEGTWAADGTWTGVETLTTEGVTTETPAPAEAAPQFNAFSQTVIIDTSTTKEIKNTTPTGYESYSRVLSSPISDTDHEGALIARWPDIETLSWGSGAAGSSRNWSSDHLALSLGDSQYKVIVSTTSPGRHYRVQWLEIFYPETMPGQPTAAPIAKTFHQVVLEGTGEPVESAVFTLSPPAEDGTMALMQMGVSLNAPALLRLNDDFDERMDESEEAQPWVEDFTTESPVRGDGTLALDDFGTLTLYGNNSHSSGSFHSGTSSVKLSLMEGANKVRLIAIAPEGSGEDGAYTSADWAVIESGAELWGTYVGRKDSNGAALPNWGFYFEGLAPGKVIAGLGVTVYGQTLSAAATTFIVDAQVVARDWKTGEVGEVPGVETIFTARPEVELSVEEAEIISGGKLRLSLSGVVRDPLSELMENQNQRLPGLIFYVNDKAVAGLGGLPSLAGSAMGVRPWQPRIFEVPFSKTIEIPATSSGAILIRAQTVPNAAGERGWAECLISLGRLAADNPAPALTQMTFQWALAPSATSVDQIKVVYGSAVPSLADPLLTETGADTNVYAGQMLVDGVLRAVNVVIAFEASSYPSPVAVEARVSHQNGSGAAVELFGKWDRMTATPSAYQLSKMYPREGVLPPLKVLGISNFGGTSEETFAPAVVRVDGLQEADNEADGGMPFYLTDGNAAGLIEPFTFSPEYHYLVKPGFRNAPELLIASSSKLYPGDERVGVLRAGDNSYVLYVPGHAAIEGTSVYVSGGATGGSADERPTGATTLADVMFWYEYLFNRPELPKVNGKPAPIYLRDVFTDANCAYEIDDDDEVEGNYLWNSPSRLTIEIGSELDPLSAAYALLDAYESLVHADPIASRLLEVPELLAQRNASAKAAVAPMRELGLAVFQAQFAFISEPADIVMSVQEVVDGNMYAALGILPGVPSTVNKVIIGVGVGHVARQLILQGPALHAFRNYLAEIRPWLRYGKRNPQQILGAVGLRARLAYLNQWGHLLTREQLDIMYNSLSVLRGDGNRRILAQQMIDNGKPRPGIKFAPHHDLPEAFEPDFILAGIDPNNHEYGRWIPTDIHNKWSNSPGYVSGGPFNAEWREFLRDEAGNSIPRTKAEIIAKMNDIRAMPEFKYP